MHTGYTIVSRDVEFDEDEQAEILGYEEMLDNQCPGCGGQLDETTHPHNEDEYEADAPTRCFKCDALLRRQEEFAAVNEHTGKPLVPRAGALLYAARKR